MAGVAGMNADVAGILEQMREQQRQQAEQRNQLIAVMAQQQQPQQRPRDPATLGAAGIEEGTKLIPKFICYPQFNGSLRTGKISSSSSGEPFALSQQLLTRK